MPPPVLNAEFRNRLIGETVRAAARDSPFYGKLYRGLDLSTLDTTDDLAILPTVDKAMLAAAGSAALCPREAGPTIAIQNTSGTTGTQFWLHRSQAEQAFIQEFFQEWNSRNAETDGAPRLVLQLVSDRHGVPTGVPSNVFPLSCRLMDPSSLDKAVALLGGEFTVDSSESRVSAISGSHDDIVVLTSYLLEKGISPSEAFEVRRVSPIGRYLTPRLHDFLASAWGCRVTQRYSLAEIFGGANWIDQVGGYVFDPYLVPEILPFGDGPPLATGLGRLHLTGLRPFSILQPFIRYRTGDLFEVSTNDDGIAVHRFRGREAHALFHPRAPERMLACGLAALNALDPHPEFNRDVYAADIGIVDRSVAGWPRSRGRIEPDGQGFAVSIDVETRCEMHLFPERAEDLRRRVRSDFLDAAPALAEAVESGEASLAVTFASPGSLSELERTSRYWQ